ncbi:TonB-dependent siderophore receptor [Pseudoroseomonas globiformis]|uniref:TonB-dependent siderophore receptor n=1 Tax=Teichococcus globiformis TaxID=2307229 RepID=A0ABV7G1N7_9PROT
MRRIPFHITRSQAGRAALLGSAAMVLALSIAPVRAQGALELPTVEVGATAWRSWEHVPGYVAPQTTTGSKVDVPLIEAPQSVGVVTRDQMDDQAAQTVSDALRYTAGVLPEVRPSGRYDSVFVRGFGGGGTDAAYVNFLDGLRMGRGANYAVPNVDPWLLERIEVLRGPASVLYGQTGAGGIVNLVSRRPAADQVQEVRIEAGSNGRLMAGFDLGGRANDEGTVLFRLTGMGRINDTQYDYISEQRLAIAPAITWRPDDNTSFTVLASFQDDPEAGFYNFVPASGTVLFNPNGRLGSNLFVGDPNYQKESKRQATIGYQLEHRFDEVWTARQNFRFGTIASNREIVTMGAPIGGPNGAVWNRRALFAREHAYTFALDNQLQAEFDTGALRHVVLAGLDWSRAQSKSRIGVSTNVPTLNLYAPVYWQNIAAPTAVTPTSNITDQLGLYLQDLISYDRWRLNIGLRHDWATSEANQRAAGTHTSQSDSATTWRAGLLYLFDNGLAPYVSYSTSFLPNSGTFSPARGGNPFDPTEGEQYEAGIKYQPPGRSSFVQAAIYHITQKNVLTQDPNSLLFSIQEGEIRSRGFELEGRAALTEGLHVIGSYSYIDAEITRSTQAGVQGNPVPQVPHHIASGWANYTFRDGPLRGLSFGGGVRYVGETSGTNTDSFKVPEVTLFDAAIRYDLGAVLPKADGLQLTVNGTNLGDKEFVASCSTATNCFFGQRRLILAGVNYRW